MFYMRVEEEETKQHKEQCTSLVVVPLDMATTQHDNMRVSLANGYCLRDTIVKVSEIDTIMVYNWDQDRGGWHVRYLYAKQLIACKIVRTRGSCIPDAETVAWLVYMFENPPVGLRLTESDEERQI